MGLTIYRRHSKNCPYYRKPRNARNNRACQMRCSIWVQGSLGGEYIRKALDLTYWQPAADLVQRWELAGRIGDLPWVSGVVGGSAQRIAAEAVPHSVSPAEVLRPQVVRTHPPAATSDRALQVLEAVARFMASLKDQNLSWETIRKYRGLLSGRLVRWCEQESVVVVSELSVTRMDDFRSTWKDGPNYAVKNLERLRTFFQYCVDRDWIGRNSAKAVKAPKVDIVPTLPFSEDEMARILAACDRYRGNQDRMRAFVLVMRYSGLRISDTLSLHPDQRVGTKLRLYTTKTGEPVFVPLPPAVIEALDKIERPRVRYFTTGKAKLATDRANWSANLTALFELAEVEEGRSHRFRDTFSCSLLEQGVPVETVAMLLGNTPAVVVKHYAPWIKSRQLALEAAVQTTWQSPIAIAQANAVGGRRSEEHESGLGGDAVKHGVVFAPGGGPDAAMAS